VAGFAFGGRWSSNMKFLLTQDWPVGSAGGTRADLTIPAGTILDSANSYAWRGTPLSSPMPITSQALDQQALDALHRWYSGQTHLLVTKGF
jgi:hypothetical protein